MAAENEEEKWERIVATGYLAISRRFDVLPQAYQHLTIADTIDNVGRALLGLSISCAQCHDHKFDPISSRDYYALYGIFSSTRYPFAGSERDHVPHDLIMCKAMNRSLVNVIFATMGPTASTPSSDDIYEGKVKSTSSEEVAMLLEDAQRVVIVPGYGMAASQAQHAVSDDGNRRRGDRHWRQRRRKSGGSHRSSQSNCWHADSGRRQSPDGDCDQTQPQSRFRQHPEPTFCR